MRRLGQYSEADINSMVAAQLHHYQAQTAQQRAQQYPENSYTGRDPAQASGEHQYTPPKVRQSQWDRGGPNVPSQVPPYPYNEGQGAGGAQPFYDGQRSDPKAGLEKQPGKESRDQPRTDRSETRHNKDYNLPRTFEGLEQSFHEDIMMLSKELQDAEDAENSRHRERLKEINAQYQEKLLALRAQQANYRDEFLRKESLARQQQYQQASMNHYANSSTAAGQHGYHPAALPGEQHGYHPTADGTPPAAAGGAYGEAHRGYASGQYESFGDRADYPEFHGGGRGRGRGFEHRGQYPGNRAYNSGGRRF